MILDVGSGLGDIALDFFSKGMRAEYILLDMDKDALLESMATLASFDTEFVLADVQKLPFRRGVFDLIICSEVLEHLPDDARALRAMSGVLSKHGAMIITVPLYEDLDLGKVYGHLRSYTINSFLRLCSVEKLDIRRYLLACKTIHAIRKLALKLFGRRRMGERESAIYTRSPLIFQLLTTILYHIDYIFAAKRITFSNRMNEATLIASLTKPCP